MDVRKINDLVAEKVMGFVISNFRGEEGWGTPDQELWFSHFNPVGDIQDAWLVADKFKDVRIERNKELSPKVRADIWNPQMVSDFADTVPLAISLAALKAIGVEVNTR